MAGKDIPERYHELARKWLNKTITAAEQVEFAAWYNAGQDTPLDIPGTFVESEEAHSARILHKIKTNIGYDNKQTNKIKRIPWLSIAAACAATLIVSYIYFYIRNKNAQPVTIAAQHKPVKHDVAPGGNKALLTLSNGSQIVLNDVRNGVIANQGQTRLNKAKDDQLVYEAPAGPANSADTSYNTITTPRGGQFQIVLSDGSKVWLNAASSITFPTTFTSTERRVSITGEVYFEISKNKHLPFRVVAGKQIVEVLGTHFNINAYADEPGIKTTLIEGRVKVSAGNNTAMLKPTQQSNISNNGSDKIGISVVDTDDIIAWKSGNFVFEKAEMPFIMRQVARWYNVDVKYEGNITQRRFTGSISRNVNLSELVKMLKYTGVKFKIEDKTITVGL